MSRKVIRKRPQEVKTQERVTVPLSLHAHKHEHDHKHQLTVTPFPSADEIDKYAAIDPTLPNRLFTLIEKRVEADIENDSAMIDLEANEQDIRSEEIAKMYDFRNKGQNYGIISLFFLGLLSLGFAYLGYEKTSATIVGVTILGALTAFTGFREDKKKNHDKEDA